MTALSFQLQKSLKILFHFVISVECGHFGKLQDTTFKMNHLLLTECPLCFQIHNCRLCLFRVCSLSFSKLNDFHLQITSSVPPCAGTYDIIITWSPCHVVHIRYHYKPCTLIITYSLQRSAAHTLNYPHCPLISNFS